MVNPAWFESLYLHFNNPQFWSTDPIIIPREREQKGEQEWVALMTALLSYGRVSQIQGSVRKAISLLEIYSPRSPGEVLVDLASDLSLQRDLFKRAEGWKHRFQTGHDLIALWILFSHSIQSYGTLGRAFARGVKETDTDYGDALALWMADWNQVLHQKEIPLTYGLKYMLTSPRQGSVCKRWNMALRWMVRKDQVDLGLWQEWGLRPSHLLMPLDTHTARICFELGIRKRKALDWNTVLEVTEYFRKLNSDDPIRYDFALARMGMLALQHDQA